MSEHARAEPQTEVAEPAAASPPPPPRSRASSPASSAPRATAPSSGCSPASRRLPSRRSIADVDALQAYGKVFALQQSGADAASAKRDAIVALALSQVSKVRDENRGDGKKKGAERLKEFYRVACPSYQPFYDYGIERVGMWAAQTETDRTKTGKPWSWCAIFGVWAIRQITGIGAFAGQPIGLGKVHFITGKPDRDAAAVQKGDMICRKEQYAIEGKEKPPDVDNLNHQCLMASVNTQDPAKPTVTTVNGNGPYQSIYVRTEPLTYYWGYYDSLSETDVGAFEKTLAKDRKNRGLPPL